MGGLSIWHWLVVAVIILLLFGKGRISEMMGDLAKGIKSFKKGMADDEDEPRAEPKRIDDGRARPADPVASPESDRTHG